MDVQTIQAVRCPSCDELTEVLPSIDAYRCGSCDVIYEDRTAAEECCQD